MFDKAIKTEDIQDFKAHLHGELIGPADESYERTRRVWNGPCDRDRVIDLSPHETGLGRSGGECPLPDRACEFD